MTSQPQDFTGWLHLLTIPTNGTIGTVDARPEQLQASINIFGATIEAWNDSSQSSYNSVISNSAPDKLQLARIAESLTAEGSIWIWNSTRANEAQLKRLGMNVQKFAALPSADHPRLLFDPTVGKHAVESSLAVHSSSSRKTKFGKSIYARLSGLLAKLRLGPSIALLATRAENVNKGENGNLSAWNEMRQIEPAVEILTIISASPGRGSKCVIAGADSSGNFRIFCKVSDTEHHGEHLANEATILSDNASNFEDSQFKTPRVISQSRNVGFTRLFLAPVEGTKLHFDNSLPEDLAVSMGTLFAKTTTPHDSGSVQFIDQLKALNQNDITVQQACKHAADQLDGVAVPLGLAHRDFTFWNVLQNDSAYGVIDWEWASESHIPYQDIFHYYVHSAVNARDLHPVAASARLLESDAQARLAAYSRTARVDRSLVQPMFTLYLCDWLGIQNGLGLADAPQTLTYRELLNAVIDGKITIQ